MKRILPLLTLIALFVASCSDPQDPNPTYKSKGLITGPDMRLCVYPCCGGWFIEIEGKIYRFATLPPNTNVRLSETPLPIPVRLSWSKSGSGEPCSDDIITIHAIERE